MFTRITFLSTSAFLLTATLAAAQVSDTTRLDAMVISATQMPASRISLTQPATVITGDELRARGITRISDALRSVPGVALVQNGSVGAVNTLFLRGGESRYTKVLIDGVPVNAPGGFFDFSHLTVDNVERIEVIRGPGSVVHGADAVSGVVQIFTRQGRPGLSFSADARAGNRGTRDMSLSTSGASRLLRYSLGGGAQRTDGMVSFNNNYYNGTLSGSAGIKPREGSDLLLTARYANAEFHYPTDFTGAPVDSNAYRVQHRLTVSADARTNLSEKITGRLQLGTNEVSDMTEDIVNGFEGIANTRLKSRHKRRSADASVIFKLPESSFLTFGAERVNETERSINSDGPVGGSLIEGPKFSAGRDNNAFYSEIVATSKEGFSWTASARRDDNSDYDAATTYRVGASAPVGLMSRVRGSISTSFNAPAFNQIQPTLYTIASPDLKPERGRTWEVGAEQSLADGTARLSASYFRQRFRDMIQYVSGGPPDFLGSYDNLTEAESNGYEVELELKPMDEWSATGSYTMVKPRVTMVSDDYDGDLEPGDPLLRRPQHSGAATLTWNRAGGTSVALMGTFVGERPDLDFSEFPAVEKTLPAYSKLDIAASQSILRSRSGRSGVYITARVDNVLDKKYEDVLRFPAPRRTWLIGARLEGAM